MPNLSPGNYDTASQTSLLAVKAKTDLIGASVALESGGNLAAVKAKTDLTPPQIPCIAIRLGRGVVVQGTWIFQADATITEFDPTNRGTSGVYFWNQTGAQNDEYTFPFLSLPAGTYSLELAHIRDSGDAIVSIYHGAALLGTIDTYAAARTKNQRSAISFTIAADATAALRLKAATKNAASSAYNMELSQLDIWRTS